MIGQRAAQDLAIRPEWRKAGIGTYGMQVQYRLGVRAGYALLPPNLLPRGHADSEHNVLKCAPYIPVAQLATPRQPPQTAHLISFRAFLRPGNQSLAGT